ncbi:MAG: hypothetical protein J6T35_05490 [Bacteroidales bacterium]|nr:hypothetical protein [Bacteroidales bacterium]
MYYKKNYMRRYGLLSEDLAEVNDRYLQNKSRYIDPEQAGASNATVSSLATTLGWDTAIWDLSSAEPALR